MMEATRTKKTTFVCQFCNAIVATTFGSKDAFEKHMEDTHNILTNLNVVMALHPMTEEEKEKLMRTKRKELEQAYGLKVEVGENETTVHYGLSLIEKGKLRILQNEYLGPHF